MSVADELSLDAWDEDGHSGRRAYSLMSVHLLFAAHLPSRHRFSPPRRLYPIALTTPPHLSARAFFLRHGEQTADAP